MSKGNAVLVMSGERKTGNGGGMVSETPTVFTHAPPWSIVPLANLKWKGPNCVIIIVTGGGVVGAERGLPEERRGDAGRRTGICGGSAGAKQGRPRSSGEPALPQVCVEAISVKIGAFCTGAVHRGLELKSCGGRILWVVSQRVPSDWLVFKRRS